MCISQNSVVAVKLVSALRGSLVPPQPTSCTYMVSLAGIDSWFGLASALGLRNIQRHDGQLAGVVLEAEGSQRSRLF